MEKHEVWYTLLSGNLFILLPSILYEIGGFININAIYNSVILPITGVWLGINVVYGLLFSIPAMIIISISTLIIIEKEFTKGNGILFIWLIFCPFWFLIITDTVSYEAFLLMPVIVMVIICINTLIIIIKEHKKENIIKQNLFIWLVLWLLNAIAILSSFDMAMFCGKAINFYVRGYGSVYMELHYFRNNLNRVPSSLLEMINTITSSSDTT